MAVVEMRRVEIREGRQRIDWIAPELAPFIWRQCPEFFQCRRIPKMRPERVPNDDPRQRRARDIFNNGFLLQQIKPDGAVEDLQVAVLMEVFDRAIRRSEEHTSELQSHLN